MPLPQTPSGAAALAVLAGCLLAAVVIDSRSRRIPNVLSLGAAAAALLLAAWAGGWSALVAALGGWALGLALMLPLYLPRILGAGDVKLFAAVGAFLGGWSVVDALLYTFVAGGFTGAAALMARDGVRETLSRWGFALRHGLRAGVWLGARPRPEGEGALRAPYAIAIAAGTLAALLWPLFGGGALLAA